MGEKAKPRNDSGSLALMYPDRVSEEAAHYYAMHHECGSDP